jgi:hypothetical protein
MIFRVVTPDLNERKHFKMIIKSVSDIVTNRVTELYHFTPGRNLLENFRYFDIKW